MPRVKLSVALLIALYSLVPACSDDAGPAKVPPGATPIVLGAAISRTGVSAVATWKDAFDLAIEDANEGLRMLGQQGTVFFEARVEDTQTRSDLAAQKALDLVRTHHALMVMDGTSSDSTAILKQNYDEDPSNDLLVPVVCYSCSSPSHHNPMAIDPNPAVQAVYRNQDLWHLGMSMSSIPQSTVLNRILFQKTADGSGDVNGDGILKISVVHINDSFGTGFANALRDEILKTRADTIIEKLPHAASDDPNNLGLWDQIMSQMADNRTDGAIDARPDFLIEITFPQYSLALLRAYADAGYSIPFLHTHSMRERTATLPAGALLKDNEGTSYLPLDGISGQLFDERYRKAGKPPHESQWDAHAYDAAFLFALATIKAAQAVTVPSQITGAHVRDAWMSLFGPGARVDALTIRPGADFFAQAVMAIQSEAPINYEGASGPCDFDATGRTRNRISHWASDGIQVRDLVTYDCVNDPSTCPPQQ